jgi:transposase
LPGAEWALVEELCRLTIYSTTRVRAETPRRYDRHLLVNACCYVVRMGSSWRMLRGGFPVWQNVYRIFRHWSEAGSFERMHDRPRAMWRERQGRSSEPTAAVLDAQSRRGSPQGGGGRST